MLKVLEDSRIQIRDTSTQRQETVLVMQGGGSLGAYECGVYKTLERYGIEFDIIAGTSIGAINAAIIVGSNSEPSAKNLEQFWFTLAENVTPSFLSDNIRPIFSSIFASLYGIRNAFEPVWYSSATLFNNYYSIFYNYTNNIPHLFNITPLK
jgi:NTE family protein